MTPASWQLAGQSNAFFSDTMSHSNPNHAPDLRHFYKIVFTNIQSNRFVA
jgi:hypothetical protein